MPQKINIPEPEPGLKFIDAHCHLPFPRPKKNDRLPSDEEQYQNFFKQGGVYLISCSIDNITLKLVLDFMKAHPKNFGFTCGWAPQTVTYTSKNVYEDEWQKWRNFIVENPDQYLAIGEIGLDFHHAKTLPKRNKQIEELKRILELTKDLEKPYVLHVRNAAKHEFDRQNPKHRFNNADGANKEILRVLKEYNIKPERVMWHCFSGPENYGLELANQGFTLSVPSSAYGFNRWRKVTANAPLKALVTETDSYYQHPFKRGPINVPANARYSIAALSHTHKMSQEEVSQQTLQNALDFFKLKSL